MTLEQQVVSLPLAKRLKELGVKQESVFYWSLTKGHYMLRYMGKATKGIEYARFRVSGISAFTVAELGVLLRSTVWVIVSRPIYNQWGAYAPMCEEWKEHYADTEADARAKMLIYLIENKLITL